MNKLTNFFNQLSSNYDALYQDPAYLNMLKRLVVEVKKIKPQNILELGVGTGNLAQAILENYSPRIYLGIDCAPKMINFSKKKLSKYNNVCLEKKKIEKIDYTNKFDCIISNYTLHHLSHRDKEKFCQKAHQALAPNGVIIYGDVFINYMLPKDNPKRCNDILDIFTYRAKHYLKYIGFEKMLFEIEHMPYILKVEREILASSDFWIKNLKKAKFINIKKIRPYSKMPCDKIIIGYK